jgi:diguanylate cyclase (GGDEF)-like protein/PAS domain S-box-containing protein
LAQHDLGFDGAFEAILDAIHDGVYMTDAERRIVYWSKGAERITGYTAEEVVGCHCSDNLLVHQSLDGLQLCNDLCPLARTIDTGEPGSHTEVLMKRRDGRRLSVYVKTSRIEIGGRPYGIEVFGELEGVAGRALAERLQELSDASITDALTGLFNLRYVAAALNQHLSLFRRLGQRFGVTLIDVDKLKEINDTFGHAAGDIAIRFVAGVLGDNARRMDIVARYGGDEFIVISAAHDEAGMRTHGERMAQLVRSSRLILPENGTEIGLSISAGGTLVRESDAGEHAVMTRADEAMYTAKRNGGDRFVLVA